MHKPLTLKYRPKNFNSFTGNEMNAEIIKKAINKDRIHNSLLFAGIRGTGKTSLARVTAKALECENKDSVEPCNECLTCKDIGLNRYQDVVEMDAASNSRKTDTKQLSKTLQYQPKEGEYKIYIIDECHRLSTPAWEVLLKPIEEGLDNILFIFCTTQLQKVPGTIISRSQVFNFRQIEREDIYKRIKYINDKENLKVSDSLLKKIADRANGEMRAGITLLEQIYISKDDDEIVKRILRTLSESIIKKIIKSILKWNIKKAINYIQESEVPLEEAINQILKYIIDNSTNKKFVNIVGLDKLSKLIEIFSDIVNTNYDNKLMTLEIQLLQFKIDYQSEDKGVW